MLNKEAGLKGISGISSDMRTILAARKDGNERAKRAFDIYIHRLRSCVGAMLATLGGRMLWYLLGVLESTRIVCVPRRVKLSRFSASSLTRRKTRNRPSIRISRQPIYLFGSWFSNARRLVNRQRALAVGTLIAETHACLRGFGRQRRGHRKPMIPRASKINPISCRPSDVLMSGSASEDCGWFCT